MQSTKTPVVGFGSGVVAQRGDDSEAVAVPVTAAWRTDHVTVVPEGIALTVNASATRPGSKIVGCPRPGPPGETALSSPIAIVRCSALLLSYPKRAVKVPSEPGSTQVTKTAIGSGSGAGTQPFCQVSCPSPSQF